MNLKEIIRELKKLNPYVTFYDYSNDKYSLVIAQCDDCEKLKFPDGFTYTKKGELIKEKEIIYLMSIEDYLIKQA